MTNPPPLNIERANGIPAKNIITQLERKKEILIDSFIHFFIDILPVSLFFFIYLLSFFFQSATTLPRLQFS
jgi:hypothetical protein